MTNNTTAALTDEQWLDLASRHANAEWNSTGYLDSIKAVCADFALLTSPRAAGLPNVIEKIAEQWDGCFFDAPGGCDIDIGEAIRAAAKRLDAAPAAPVADPLRRRVERLLVELHAEGRLSEGQCAKMLDIPRIDWRELAEFLAPAAQAVAADGASDFSAWLATKSEAWWEDTSLEKIAADAWNASRAAVSPATADERAAALAAAWKRHTDVQYGDGDGMSRGLFRAGWNEALRFAASQAAAPAEAREPHADDVAVDEFAIEMKAKMAAARAKGRSGWETCAPADLSRMLREHVEKGDPRDVANFSMMLYHHGAPISAPADAGEAVAPSADLIARCIELRELSDHGESDQLALRALAGTYRRDIHSVDRRAMAVSHTHREAVQYVLDAARAQGAQGGKGGEA